MAVNYPAALSQFQQQPAAQAAYSGAQQLVGDASGLQNLYSWNAAGALGNAQNQSYAGMTAGDNLAGSLAGNLPQAQKDFGYGNQALSTGFNQNNSLYNQEVSDITDQTRAAESARGITNTPYGAGVEADTLMHFNQQWQQQQLQNQATAAQTASSLDSAGQGLENANTAAVSAGESIASGASMLPTQALSSILQAGTASSSVLSSGVSAFLNYLQTSIQGATQAQVTRSGLQGASDYLSQFDNPQLEASLKTGI
jgi:hypothetical protein